jgi:hypothetical protein
MSVRILPKRSETTLSIPSTSTLEVGEIAMNITDGKFFTKSSAGIVKEMGGAGAIGLQDVTNTNGTTTNNITLNGSDLIFEGFLENSFETFLRVEEPTADRIIKLPNASGTLATVGDALAYAIVFGS